MTISTTTNRQSYTGDAVSTVFSVPFPFLANADISVYVSGTQVLTGFTTTGAGTGTGNVTFVAAPANGAAIVLVRTPDYLQSTALPSNGPFPAKSVETMTDKSMIGLQRVSDQLGRSLVLSDGDSAATMTLPLKAARASNLLGFDSNGLPIAVTGTSGVTISAVMTPVVQAVSLAAGRTALGSSTSGDTVFTGTAAQGRTALGSGAAGDAIFLATTVASAKALVEGTRADFATAATLDFTGTLTTNNFRLTGTTNPTAINIAAGRTVMCLVQTGTWKIPNGAAFVNDSAADIITRAGDFVFFRGTAANVAEVTIIRANPIVVNATVATTSGTSVDITGIPADANEIDVNFVGVSTSGTSAPQLQLGSGSVQSSGYLGNNSALSGGGVVPLNFTAAFGIGVSAAAWAAAAVFHGTITLKRQTGNTWVCSGTVGRSDSAISYITNGSVTLAGAIDRIRLTTAGGADTFDAGAININVKV